MQLAKSLFVAVLSTTLLCGGVCSYFQNFFCDEIVPVVAVKNCCAQPITIDITCGRTLQSLGNKEITSGATVTFYACESVINDLWAQEDGILYIGLKIKLLDKLHVFTTIATLSNGQDEIEIYENKIKIIER